MTRPDVLHLSNDPEANRLIARDPAALLIGFLLDQQITVQKAFEGPLRLLERAGTIEPAALAAMPLDELTDHVRARPAIHRFPGNMAKRVQQAMQLVVDRYDGDVDRIWLEATDTADVRQRLEEIPGLGAHTALTFTTVLARRFGLPFAGFEDELPPYGCLGDVDSPEALEAYQAAKRAHKAALRAAKA